MAAAAPSARGIFVSMNQVEGFGDLGKDEAERVLYEELIPKCEKVGVMLSQYGNHNAGGSLANTRKYEEEKGAKKLFDIKAVQQVFSHLDTYFTPKKSGKYEIGSYGFKHTIERKLGYKTNGDVIAAMLLKGNKARFGEGKDLNVNCTFRGKVVEEESSSRTHGKSSRSGAGGGRAKRARV